MAFYKQRWFWVTAGVLAIPVLAAAWWLGSPLFLDDVVDEEFPLAATALVPEGMTRADVETEMAEAADSDTAAADAMPSDQPTALLRGAFADADDFHQGSGTATIYELGDGSRILRFEDFDVTNGPDLHVIVTPVESPATREDVTSAGYVDLGGLKGNIGDQNYEIPSDFDLSTAGSIVIYCQPFHVIFSVASLGDA